MDLDNVKSGNGDKKPRIEDVASVYKFPEKKWVTVRLIGGVTPNAGYWVKVKTNKGKETKFYTACPSFDPATQERDSTKYDPWGELAASEGSKIKAGTMAKDEAKVQFAVGYFMNAIIRSQQKSKPSSLPKKTKSELKSGFKEKDSDTWTPVNLVKLGKSFIGKVKELKGLNTIESAKTGAVKAFPVNDPKFGRDIRVFYDSDKAPADQYQVQLGDKRTPLSEEELAYLIWDTSILTEQSFVEAAVRADFEGWASRNGVKVKAKSKPVDDEDDEDEEPAPKKGKKKPAAKDDDEDFDSDFDDEDEDEKPAPKSKAKSKPADDEDEDEDEDDFDDEDEEPAPKKSKSKPAAKKAKPADDKDDFDDEDSDDEDEDDFDDEDDEEPAPKSKSKAKPAAKKTKPSDDEDEDDFDDEDDEEPAPKKSKAKPAAKKSKPVDDEDEDFDADDEDDFDDEDDEEPAPKSKSKPKAKPAAKKKSKPSDDEDDFDDFDD